MDENKIIGFKLAHIVTNEFATFVTSLSSDYESLLNANLDFSFSEENKLVGVHVKFVFECNEKPFIVIAVSCFFSLENWDEYFDVTQNTLTLKKNFAQHIAVITIGTTRGILHNKTEQNLILNSYLLPSINVLEMVKDDIIIGAK